MTKNPGIKIPYYTLDFPLVEGTRCVQVRIPDDDRYLHMLGSLISMAGRWFNYQRDDTHKGAQIAKLWALAYVETDWEGCMNCEELQACLEPLLAEQTAAIINLVTNINNYGTSTPGLPMTIEQLAQNLAGTSNPDCNLNILWAQCLALVQYTNRSIVDILEKVEAATNINELAALVDGVPLLGWIAEFFGSELMTDTINYFQEAIAESYAAQYTEAVENELACGLFCLSQLGCDISVGGIYDFMFDRVADVVPDNPSEFIDMIEMLAGIDFDGTNVVDLMFWFCWGGVKLASFAVGEPVTTAALNNITALAVNDANNDWELLCTCPNCDDTFTIVIGTDNLPTSIISVVMQVQPLGTELPPTYWARRIVLTAPQPVSSWEFDYDYGGGATGDPLTYGFSTGVGELPEQTGHAVLTTDTPATSLIIDLGYSGSEHAYDDSPMFLSNVIWCE